MSGEAQLEALLEIINSSARQAIAEYKKSSSDVPTINSTELHPLDAASDTVKLRKAIRLLEGACQQLCASLAPPQHTIVNLAQSHDWACFRIVLCKRIVDVLENFPGGLHVNELSKYTGLRGPNLARVLRPLASKGCFTEVAKDVFANNRLSLVIKSTSNTGIFTRMMTQDAPKGADTLFETLSDPKYAKSSDTGNASIPYAIEHTWTTGEFFNTLPSDDFHKAMVGSGEALGMLSVLHNYPWNDVNSVCDIGSSIGTFSIPLAKTYPHLKIINQDLGDVVTKARDVWQKEAPEALADGRIDFVALNFLEEAPVAGQDVYYLRQIIHDWPDASASVILRNVRKAMAPHSRVLIHDYVATGANRSDAKPTGLDVAPEPMLPNFGAGNTRLYQQDLIMWIVHDAKERTLEDSISLAKDAGLRFEKVYDLGQTAVLEFTAA
ncbi:hypothetical protein ID866_3818 [Astraeus odoratus]|nr:hypothetical protein ID866_3818 [Astraeus odoratus]